MKEIKTLQDMRERFQAGFDNNEESLELFGKTYSTQLKAYLVESNLSNPIEKNAPTGKWEIIDRSGWFSNDSDEYRNSFFLDATRDRVWIVYSILDAKETDFFLDSWVKRIKGLDKCWLSRNQLLHWQGTESWMQKGLGLKFSDGLMPEEDSANFSLKAWYGANRIIPGLDDVLEKAKEEFAIYSVRWQKKRAGSVVLSGEWYSSGKITINRAQDVDEVLVSIAGMANRYEDALKEATSLRDKTMGAFELDFSQEIDLEAFSNTVIKGKGDMNLWLVETERETDFRRFRGIDLHTWDRVLMDVGPDYAYLTIPGNGCVNAAPRIATIQGEDNAGKTSIYHDGVEVFA